MKRAAITALFVLGIALSTPPRCMAQSVLPTSGNMIDKLHDSIHTMLSVGSPVFGSMGLRLVTVFAIISLWWFGTHTALASASGNGGFKLDAFVELMLLIAFSFAAVMWSTGAIPFYGDTLPNLIFDQAGYMANHINSAAFNDMNQRFMDFILKTSQANSSSWIPTITTFQVWLVDLVIAGFQAVEFGMVAIGLVLSAALALMAPFFLSFLVAPIGPFRAWGWNWIWTYTAVCFFRTLLAAVNYVLSSFIVSYFVFPTGGLSLAEVAGMLGSIILVLGSSTLVLLAVPPTCYKIFHGGYK
jgi:hypothetical protein